MNKRMALVVSKVLFSVVLAMGAGLATVGSAGCSENEGKTSKCDQCPKHKEHKCKKCGKEKCTCGGECKEKAACPDKK
jgi:hypothetical protein